MKRSEKLGLTLVVALAGSSPAQIVVNQLPYNAGGTTSDLEFFDYFHFPHWARAADDIKVAADSEVVSLNWWGFYREDNPPANEQFQIRLYANQESASLPGDLLYESVVSDPQRDATGRVILIGGLPREFRFHAHLPSVMHLDANQPYWLEITQVNSLEQWYFAEYSRAETTGYAFINDVVSTWTRSTATSDLAVQLIVPEPATAAILAVGLAALVANRRRRTPVPGPPGRLRKSAADKT